MQLVIVRHAEAAPGAPDALRPLTPTGHKHARAVGSELREQGIEPDAVVTSPLLRACETADELGLGKPEVDDRLAPGATPDDIRDVVKGRGKTVLIVAHQPDCGIAAAAFTGGPPPPFPPGGYVRLELGRE